MRGLLLALAGFAVVSSVSVAALTPAELLERPIVIGASISSEYTNVVSPGRRLALQFTVEDQIRRFAFAGQKGVEVLGASTWDKFSDRSIVLAVDLMFWDSTQAVPSNSIGALWTFISKLSRAGIPIVLADVPPLHPNWQPGLEMLNREIHFACQSYVKCKILPLDQMFRDAIATGYVDHHGQRYTMSEIIPDGLHVSDVGSEYIAERMLDIVQELAHLPSARGLLDQKTIVKIRVDKQAGSEIFRLFRRAPSFSPKPLDVVS